MEQELSVSLNTSRSLCPLARRELGILGEAHPGQRLPPASAASAATLLCLGATNQVEVKEGVRPVDEFKNHHHIHS